ncbi:hypothetical protein [Amycolatopsis anabasis]|uniref:hypothetical protein n=1 Tax=Amycolatopsis anabasis TaxID=1840409 RepID=UPI00131EBAB4|nr:hypothetical protein [Amycolatopsis anabasis]
MSVAPVLTIGLNKAAIVLAQQPGNGGDKGGQGEDFGKSSPLGLLILILFLIAVALLVRSMTKHLKRVPATFDPEPEQSEIPEAKEEAAEPTPETKPAEAARKDEAKSPPA